MVTPIQTPEERFEQLLKLNTEKDAELDYLRRQLDQSMGNNRREIQSSGSHSESEDQEMRPEKKKLVSLT